MVSERLTSPPIVVLDANLLYPFQLRNLLVQFGVDGVIAPRWTARIHDEWIGNLVAASRAPLDRLRRTRDLMDRALPHADVQGWEQHMGVWRFPIRTITTCWRRRRPPAPEPS